MAGKTRLGVNALPAQPYGSFSGKTEEAAPATMSALDFQQIIKRVYDPTNNALRCLNIGAPSASSGTLLNFEQVIKMVYDKDTNRLRIVRDP